eukprot:1140892-Pelagomonas_calceolata.AAC.8
MHCVPSKFKVAAREPEAQGISRTALLRLTSSAMNGTSEDHGQTSSVAILLAAFLKVAGRLAWRDPTSTANS